MNRLQKAKAQLEQSVTRLEVAVQQVLENKNSGASSSEPGVHEDEMLQEFYKLRDDYDNLKRTASNVSDRLDSTISGLKEIINA